MVIKNFDKLATSPLRRQALLIAEEGYEAINTARAVNSNVSLNTKKQLLTIYGRKFNLKNFRRIFCIGFGKAALEAVTSLSLILKDNITAGYVIDLTTGSLPNNIISRAGAHPYPSKDNIDYTKELTALFEDASDNDLVICVVSGGGSSLLNWPDSLALEQQISLFKILTRRGASIAEINTVRKHVDRVKGGNLVRLMYPATVLSLIFSDVPGDDLSMVASGPTVFDRTTTRDALKILYKYDVLQLLGLPSLRLCETPKEEKYFKNVENVLAMSARTALLAMKEKAEDLGFDAEIFSDHFQGEAREIGRQAVEQLKRHTCLLGAGESTVTITGKGLGGRNQEIALGALEKIGPEQVVVCLASDGRDNTDAAGAIADSSTKSKAAALGLDPRHYLDNNDSFRFFEGLGDLVYTGLTGSNVSDFFVCLKQ